MAGAGCQRDQLPAMRQPAWPREVPLPRSEPKARRCKELQHTRGCCHQPQIEPETTSLLSKTSKPHGLQQPAVVRVWSCSSGDCWTHVFPGSPASLIYCRFPHGALALSFTQKVQPPYECIWRAELMTGKGNQMGIGVVSLRYWLDWDISWIAFWIRSVFPLVYYFVSQNE